MAMKNYVPRCPNADCKGGDQSRLYKVGQKSISIPEEVLSIKGAKETIYRCNYCGLLWAQEDSKRIGLDPKPLGIYRNLEFFSIPDNFRIRRENISSNYAQ